MTAIEERAFVASEAGFEARDERGLGREEQRSIEGQRTKVGGEGVVVEGTLGCGLAQGRHVVECALAGNTRVTS